MTMLPLTILPPDQRRTIRMYVAYEMIKASGGIIITTLSVVAIALLMAKLILNFYFIQLVSDTTKLTKIARSYDTEIKQFNQYLAAISDMQQGYHPWHNDIAVIMQQFSAQVGITQATFRSHKKNHAGGACRHGSVARSDSYF